MEYLRVELYNSAESNCMQRLAVMPFTAHSVDILQQETIIHWQGWEKKGGRGISKHTCTTKLYLSFSTPALFFECVTRAKEGERCVIL